MSNPLEDVVPAKARKYVYASITLAALVFGVWQASQGDWVVFVGSLLSSLTTLTAAANTHEVKPRSDYDPGYR